MQFLQTLGGFQSLESLYLPNTLLEDSDVVHLESLHFLKQLTLRDSQLSSEATLRLQLALPKCEIWLVDRDGQNRLYE